MLSPLAKLILGGINDFLITAGSTMLGYMVANGAAVMPSKAGMLVAVVTGAIGAGRHVNAMLKEVQP